MGVATFLHLIPALKLRRGAASAKLVQLTTSLLTHQSGISSFWTSTNIPGEHGILLFA